MEIILSGKPPVAKRGKRKPIAGQVPDLDGYFYVPAIGLYVAKEKTLMGEDWRTAHRKLQEKNLQMLTIKQFVETVNYLENNSVPDKDSILDEIFNPRKENRYRGEWLDAYFTEKRGEMYIAQNHRIKGKRLVPLTLAEKLEDCLMEQKYIDLSSANSQGLPTIESSKQDVFYYYSKCGSYFRSCWDRICIWRE